MVFMEIARTDPSIATFHGVHSGLAMGSISVCGSDEQRDAGSRHGPPGTDRRVRTDRARRRIGRLTRSHHDGRRDGDHWILNGQKKWIGNASFADLVIIWARDEEDNQVKGFVVEPARPV